MDIMKKDEDEDEKNSHVGARTKDTHSRKRLRDVHGRVVSDEDSKKATRIAALLADDGTPAPPPNPIPGVRAIDIVIPQHASHPRQYASSASEILNKYLTAGFDMKSEFLTDPVERDHYTFIDKLLPRLGVLAPMSVAMRKVFSLIRGLRNKKVNRLTSTELMMPPFQSPLIQWIVAIYNQSMYTSTAVIPTKVVTSLNIRSEIAAYRWFNGYKPNKKGSLYY